MPANQWTVIFPGLPTKRQDLHDVHNEHLLTLFCFRIDHKCHCPAYMHPSAWSQAIGFARQHQMPLPWKDLILRRTHAPLQSCASRCKHAWAVRMVREAPRRLRTHSVGEEPSARWVSCSCALQAHVARAVYGSCSRTPPP